MYAILAIFATNVKLIVYTWGVGPLGHHPTSILEVMNESSSSTKALSSSPTGTTPVAMGNNDQLILLLPKRVK